MAKPKPVGDPPTVKLPIKEPRRDPRVQPDRRSAPTPMPVSPDGDPHPRRAGRR
jgi:hypothetical protein